MCVGTPSPGRGRERTRQRQQPGVPNPTPPNGRTHGTTRPRPTVPGGSRSPTARAVVVRKVGSRGETRPRQPDVPSPDDWPDGHLPGSTPGGPVGAPEGEAVSPHDHPLVGRQQDLTIPHRKGLQRKAVSPPTPTRGKAARPISSVPLPSRVHQHARRKGDSASGLSVPTGTYLGH